MLVIGHGLVTKSCLTLVTPWIIICQAPLSMGFCRQEYWSGLPFSSPEDLPELNSGLLHCQLILYLWILPGKAEKYINHCKVAFRIKHILSSGGKKHWNSIDRCPDLGHTDRIEKISTNRLKFPQGHWLHIFCYSPHLHPVKWWAGNNSQSTCVWN